MIDPPAIFKTLPRFATTLAIFCLLAIFVAISWPAITIPSYVFGAIQPSEHIMNFKIGPSFIPMPAPTNTADGKLHLPIGKHYMLDFRGVDHDRLAFLETPGGESFLSQEITRAGMTVLGSRSHHFPGGGLSLVFLLAESHMSIHSWPEHSFVAIDVYTCGDSLAADRLVDSMYTLFKPANAKSSFIERGANLTHSINIPGIENFTLFGTDRSTLIVPPATVDICVNADFDGDDCSLWRNASLIYSEHSGIQLVEVVERQSRERCLLLDGVVQFCNSSDNDLYTRSITDPVVLPLLERDRDVDIYVIGGGDGWIANHLISSYSPIIRSVHVIDIDPLVTNITKTFFPTKGSSSFEDPRVSYINADAAAWLRSAVNESADAVIVDCTDHTVESASVLYTNSFYLDVLRVLRQGGRFSQQMNSKNDLHESFQRKTRMSWKTLGFIDITEWYENISMYGGLLVMMGGVKGSSNGLGR